MLDGNSERSILLHCPQSHNSPIESAASDFLLVTRVAIFIITRVSDADLRFENARRCDLFPRCKILRIAKRRDYGGTSKMKCHSVSCVRGIVLAC